jgi:hypothetical protein
MKKASIEHSKLAIRYAEKSLILKEEINKVRAVASQIVASGR